MKLAETLKKEILNDGKFDAQVVTEYLVNFFKEQPTSSLAIDFFDHCDWTKKGVAIDMGLLQYGHKYATLITLPESWACDMVKFVRDNGFIVWEDRHSVTKELFYLRVSIC